MTLGWYTDSLIMKEAYRMAMSLFEGKVIKLGKLTGY